jgi:hypothetical protein
MMFMQSTSTSIQQTITVFLNISHFFRSKVNAPRGQLPLSTKGDIEDAEQMRAIQEIANQPRSKESRDHNKLVVKAISQHNEDDDLTSIDIVQYMDQAIEKNNSNPDNSRIRHPMRGDIFIFDVSTIQISCFKVLLDDGYPWRSKKIISQNGLKKQSCYYNPSSSQAPKSDFKKTIYFRDKDNTCLIHYRGDHESAQHKLRCLTGQEKLASKVVIKQRILQVDPDRKMGPTKVMEEIMKEFPPDGFDLAVGHPQSRDQVRYYQRQADKERQIGGCELINITYLTKIFGQEYVVNHSGQPHKLFFLAHEQSIANMNHLLKTLKDKSIPLVLHFDTTFKFGNYYLSPLVYRHPQLTPRDQKESEVLNPDAIIPLVHVLHENKSHQTLKTFFFWLNALIKTKFPKFAEQTKVLVSDREFKDEYMENTHRVYCKYHLLKDLEREGMVKLKMKKTKNMGIYNIQFYVASVSDLMNSPTLEEYIAKRDELFSKNKMWTSPPGKALQAYYMANMDQDIIDRAGVWHLAKIGLGHMKNGLTNNASETYNSTIRDLKNKGNTRQTADISIIKLFGSESIIHNYVMAAYYGNGNASLTV